MVCRGKTLLLAALVSANAVQERNEPDDVAAITATAHVAAATATAVTGTLVAAAQQKQESDDVTIAVHIVCLRVLVRGKPHNS